MNGKSVSSSSTASFIIAERILIVRVGEETDVFKNCRISMSAWAVSVIQPSSARTPSDGARVETPKIRFATISLKVSSSSL